MCVAVLDSFSRCSQTSHELIKNNTVFALLIGSIMCDSVITMKYCILMCLNDSERDMPAEFAFKLQLILG